MLASIGVFRLVFLLFFFFFSFVSFPFHPGHDFLLLYAPPARRKGRDKSFLIKLSLFLEVLTNAYIRIDVS